MATRLFGQSARVPSAEARLRRLSQGIATPWSDGRHSVFAGELVIGQTLIGLGLNALASAKASTYNIGIGEDALYNVTTGGTYNIAIGYHALDACTTGKYNIGIGANALGSSQDGGNSIAIGKDALAVATSSSGSIAIGTSALSKCTSGYWNVAIGKNSLLALTDGVKNVAIGEDTLPAIKSGASNVAVGCAAGFRVTGSYNTIVGDKAAYYLATGTYNIVIGQTALYSETTGSYNVAIGGLDSQVGSSYNVAIGMLAGCHSGLGSNNTFLGYGAGQNEQGSGSVCIGYYAGKDETGSNKLYIANSSTATPLIYGEFDTPLLKINAPFTCTGNLTIGSGTAATDYTLTFDGETNNGVLTWMEDEDYFSFGDDLFVPAGESLYFRDTAISLTSSDDGHLDLTADVQIDLNGITLATDKLAFTQTDQNEYIDSLADGYLDLCATTAIRFRNATADTDVLLEFFGTSATGQVYWMEDEDYFRFVDCLKTEGGRKVNVSIPTTTYSVLATDEAVVCNSTTAFTVSLPAASGSGRKLYVKNINTGTVTVAGNGSDTIDGVTTQALGRWDAVVLIDYAANAWIIV